MLLDAFVDSVEYLLKTGPSIILGVILAELLVSLGWLQLLHPHRQQMLRLKACTTKE